MDHKDKILQNVKDKFSIMQEFVKDMVPRKGKEFRKWHLVESEDYPESARF